ncbi:MAG TPA: hypothetical protein VMY42_15050 [Thermoguttaceae bacterium]|nr:hypothetical protein [Thermoguttaceae bacterium]
METLEFDNAVKEVSPCPPLPRQENAADLVFSATTALAEPE